MKFHAVLLLVAASLAALFVTSQATPVVKYKVPETADHLEGPQTGSEHFRVKRASCEVGSFACNLHCQWKGYEKGFCSSNKVCNCRNYSG